MNTNNSSWDKNLSERTLTSTKHWAWTLKPWWAFPKWWKHGHGDPEGTPQLPSHTPASPAFLSLKLNKHLPTLWPLSCSLCRTLVPHPVQVCLLLISHISTKCHFLRESSLTAPAEVRESSFLSHNILNCSVYTALTAFWIFFFFLNVYCAFYSVST